MCAHIYTCASVCVDWRDGSAEKRSSVLSEDTPTVGSPHSHAVAQNHLQFQL